METEDQALRRLMKDHDPAHIDDAGFTLRVLTALPPPRSRLATWRRPLLLLTGCLAGVLLPLLLDGPGYLGALGNLITLATQQPLLPFGEASLGALPLTCLGAGLLLSVVWVFKALRSH
jgi:hypothetical protein